MAILDQSNSTMPNGTAVAENCVCVLWYWKPKSSINMQKYYHLKKEGSQLHIGQAMSCLKRVEKDLTVMET
jgi:hypothetical protein